MDHFKQYLQDNEDKLDIDIPSHKLWDRIELQSATIEKPLLGKLLIIKYAVAACALALSVTVVYECCFSSDKDVQPAISQKTPAGTLLKKNAAIVNLPRPSPALVPVTKSKSITVKKLPSQSKPVSLDYSYKKMIALRIRKLSSMAVFAASPDYFNVFTFQLKQIERDELQIKIAIRSHGYSDELMDQLIEVYQQKLTLLKRFQWEIQKINNQVNQHAPVESPAKPYYIQL